MKNNASFVYSLCLVACDFLALSLAFAGAFLLRGVFDARPVAYPMPISTYFGLFLITLPFWILIFALLGLYNRSIYEKRFSEIGRLFIGSFVGLLFVLAVDFVVVRPVFPSKLVPFYGFALAFLFLVLFRNIARWVRTLLFGYNIGINNVLIIGDNEVAKELVSSLKNSKRTGYHVVGVVCDNKKFIETLPNGVKTYNSLEAATKQRKRPLHSIIQTKLYADSGKNNEVLSFAQANHISFRFVPGNSELFSGNIDVELFQSSVPVIAVHQTKLVGWGRVAKRLFDIFSSLFGLIILSPLFVIIALLIKVTDPRGPIFFKQERLTRFGGKFHIIKFRTMRAKMSGRDPEEVFLELGKPELIKEYRENRSKVHNDPRITFIGKFLRKTSLDELPQLLNVLRGDISLVGPRAIPENELVGHESVAPIILSVKSGLTGLAQVSVRNDPNLHNRLRLDVYYVQNWTFWMDITILVKTVRVLFSGD